MTGPRTYDPVLGRFLQPDPVIQPGQAAFGYADGRPVKMLDRSGYSGSAAVPLEPEPDTMAGQLQKAAQDALDDAVENAQDLARGQARAVVGSVDKSIATKGAVAATAQFASDTLRFATVPMTPESLKQFNLIERAADGLEHLAKKTFESAKSESSSDALIGYATFTVGLSLLSLPATARTQGSRAARTIASDASDEFVSLWRAPKVGKAELEQGFSAANHPLDGFSDGRAYFAGPGSRSIAEEYARHGPYEDGVLEVRMDRATFDQYFAPLERSYQGGPHTEVPVPNTLFDLLNSLPRFFHPTGG
jgi:hypothetical protein